MSLVSVDCCVPTVNMPVDITEITDEDDAPQQSTPAPAAQEKKPAVTGVQLIQDAEATMAKVANTLSKGAASGDLFTTLLAPSCNRGVFCTSGRVKNVCIYV